ncbi:MAG: ATP-binding cassette domain-containing protein [Candidatus Lokiarchaeota archaeon]|nr:ATP-binding cassette domain-containing protein [Candidatus Lokiarchaeota archaeon]
MTEVFDIKTEWLSKDFGKVQAVKDLELKVKKGTTFGYLGPNGAGKTTTVRMLAGLLLPTNGRAKVCGFDVYTQREEIKRVTGLLPESPGLYSKLSAVEFLEFIGALNDFVGERLLKRIEKLLLLLGLEGRQHDLLESYSSGMKQKVLVASTILHDPQLVFLDEPTSRLDPAASALVKEIIRAMAEKTDTTFFICTHMTDLAEDICDVIGIISNGTLTTYGTPQEVVDKVGGDNLQDAYLKIVGSKVNKEDLLRWRS